MTQHKPETYWYWLKSAAKAPFNLYDEFSEAVEALRTLMWFVFVFHIKVFILLTFPVSVPLIAYLAFRQNKKVILQREQAMQVALEEMNKLTQKVDK